MLEHLRQNQRNVLIYVLFGIIIAAFVISFGPGGKSGAGGTGGAGYVAKVAGSTITDKDLRVASQSFNNGLRQETILDKLIERELLIDEAERLGLRASPREAQEFIASGRIMALGLPMKLDTYMKEGRFDYDKFKLMMQNGFGVTPIGFVEIQQRELLASRMRELLAANTKVLQDEVKSDFEQKNLQVNLEFVRYAARKFEDDVEPPAADVAAYIAAHKDELKKNYDERPFLYKKLDKQARLRHIQVSFAKDAAPAAVEAAKKKADAIVAKVKGGAAFAEVAKTDSDDERTKKRGGLMGWRKAGFTALGKEIEDKVFAGKAGGIIGPEKTDHGWEILYIDEFREGDVALEVAEKEMAEDAVRKQKAIERAKAEAQKTVDRLAKGEKFEAIVPKAAVEDDAHAGQRSDEPKLAETGPFPKRGELVPDIGVSADLVKKAFELKVGEVAGPFEVTSAAVVVRVKERKEPDMADYEKRKDELRRQFERDKWKEIVDGWTKQRCLDYKQAGKIKVNPEALGSDEAPGPLGKKRMNFEPCAPLGKALF